MDSTNYPLFFIRQKNNKMSQKTQKGNFTVEVYEGRSVIKIQNATVTVFAHHKSLRHFQRQKTFLSNTRTSGFVKFKDIPLGDYKIVVKKDGYEDSVTIKKQVSTPGEDKQGHFAQPNNLLKVNLFRSPYLLFNGVHLTWVEKNNNVISWPAVSGKKGYQSPDNHALKNKGPLPEGKWLVKQSEYQKMPDRSWIEEIAAELGRTAWPGGESSWGRNRIWIHPATGTEVFNRSGFSIHGGDSPGSAGCIDMTSHMSDFIKKYLQHGNDMILEVNYEKKPTSYKQ